jgi:hypothetical protein
MNITELLLKEQSQEYPNTRKMLALIPDDQFNRKKGVYGPSADDSSF